jgi:hypothetical protein
MSGKGLVLAQQDEESHEPQAGRDDDRREFIGLQRRWVGTARGGHTAHGTAVRDNPLGADELVADVVGVLCGRLASVERRDSRHVVGGEREVEDADVLGQPLDVA